MIVNSNCLDWMASQPDNSIDCIICDPPYGLKFMSKKWDYELPSIEIWQEALRICKPGSWLLAFGGSRTYHRLTCSIEDAGWEIRDCIMWMHGQGFPKGKGCLKPAYEPIILARKKAPKPELNIDKCRVGCEVIHWMERRKSVTYAKTTFNKLRIGETNIGRYPANVILDEVAAELLDQQSGFSKSSQSDYNFEKGKHGSVSIRAQNIKSGIHFGDSGGASRFFYCAKASSSERNRGCENLEYKKGGIKNDSGRGFSETDPYKQILVKNNHPCVKPLKLMEYLIKLVAPKDGVILDPFCGSGSTLVAAKKLGYKAIGIELDPEYCKIANARIEAQETQYELAI